MAKTFTAQVDDWVKKSDARMLAVAKTASQSVVEEIILGTPVKTGFLRASFNVTNDSIRPIVTDSRPPKGTPDNFYDEPPYALTINGLKMGQTLNGSFTAGYGPHIEYGANGRAGVRMVGKAVQKWDKFVKDATRKARARVK